MKRFYINLPVILILLTIPFLTLSFPLTGTSMMGKEVVEETKGGIRTISVAEAYSMFGKEGIIFLDVREPDEFKAGHIPGAIHIPRGLLESRIGQQVPDRDTTMVVYCRSGNRSALASATLIEMGYGNVINMGGGFRDWQNAGYPAE